MRHHQATPPSVLLGALTGSQDTSQEVGLPLGLSVPGLGASCQGKTDLPGMLSAVAAFSSLGLGAATSDQSQNLRGPIGRDCSGELLVNWGSGAGVLGLLPQLLFASWWACWGLGPVASLAVVCGWGC